VRVLLDTQVWLWMLAAPERLSKTSRGLVRSAANDLVLSADPAIAIPSTGCSSRRRSSRSFRS
jgi:PIN domain nuclease of toxin-antitoxin system